MFAFWNHWWNLPFLVMLGLVGVFFVLQLLQTYWDAVHYIATSLSVGYAKIFSTTEIGKIIGAAVMTVGPALSSRVLDRPAEPSTDPALLAKLDDILSALKRLRPA
jgi:hypothetical protein